MLDYYSRKTWSNIYEQLLRLLLLKNFILNKEILPNQPYRNASQPAYNRKKRETINLRIRKDASRKGATAAERSTRKKPASSSTQNRSQNRPNLDRIDILLDIYSDLDFLDHLDHLDLPDLPDAANNDEANNEAELPI